MAIAVFHNCGCIFYHITKCGGKSIRAMLGDEEVYYSGGCCAIPARLQQLWSFAAVRNPFDRFVSSWHFALQQGRTNIQNPLAYLKWVLDNDLTIYGENWASLQDNKLWCKTHTAPMTTPRFRVHLADHIVRFENFEKDMREVCKKVGVPYKAKHINASKHKPWPVYYKEWPGLEHEIQRWFAEDFATLKYPAKVSAYKC